jgi:VRR-NUC domain
LASMKYDIGREPASSKSRLLETPAEPKRRQQRERHEHQAFVQDIKWRLPPTTFFFHPPMGGRRSAVTGAQSLGAKAGMPDVMLIASGKIYGVELKAPGGRLSPVQQECHSALRAAGVTVGVACGLDEPLDLLQSWGIIP